ncbi:MAG: hypothetical protein F9K35_11015 [Burkholderiaceae bacterium]|nr:MAG: hypothetical protein F9K35_11015 [Burkholderiaceae bacterium]
MIELHRRHFLAASGAAAATGVQASVPALGTAHATRPAWRVLGIAPASQKLPTLATEYTRGVELGLAQSGADVHVNWLSAGPLPSAQVKVIESVLQQRKADALMGWIPPLLSKKLVPLAQKAGVPLWISDTGADLAEPSPAGASFARHTLELCAVASALADTVYAQCGPRAFLSLGWHESGYDLVQAFQDRWRSLGGQVTGRHIAGVPGQAHEFEDLKQAIVSRQPDVVVALHSGPQAARFAQWWREQRPALRTELAGFPWLAEHASTARTVMSWPTADQAAPGWAARFHQAKLPWTAAALLGAEAGASLGAALMNVSPGSSALWAGLQSRPLSGPRGERQWAPAGNDSTGPLWERSVLHSQARQLQSANVTLSASAAARGGWTTGYFLT